MKFCRYIKFIFFVFLFLPISVRANAEISVVKTFPLSGATGVTLGAGDEIWLGFGDPSFTIEKSSLNGATVKLEAINGSDNLIINYFKTRECAGGINCEVGFGFDSFKRPGSVNFSRARLMPNTTYRLRILEGAYGFKGDQRVNIAPFNFSFTTGAYSSDIRFISGLTSPSVNSELAWETEWPTVGEVIQGQGSYFSSSGLIHRLTIPSLPLGRVGVSIKATDALGLTSSRQIFLEVLNIFEIKSQVENDKAFLTFKTSRQAKTCIRYGISQNLENIACSNNVGISHQLTISGLLFGENIYYFRLEADEVNIGKSQTGIYQFKTINAVNDYTEVAPKIASTPLITARPTQTKKPTPTPSPTKDEPPTQEVKGAQDNVPTKQDKSLKNNLEASHKNKPKKPFLVLILALTIALLSAAYFKKINFRLLFKKENYQKGLIFLSNFYKRIIESLKKSNQKINDKIDGLISDTEVEEE
jgi:hypothetical protein